METKFISEFGAEDLTNIPINVEESNSKVADSMFTKFTLPFESIANSDFIKMYGDYLSNESNNLKNKIVGKFQFENKLHDAERFVQSIQGNKLTNQIDFGFEELPNFDKKLSELPLESFDVTDIHIYAKEIAGKTWPQTNFNFPRIYTKKYSPDQQIWRSFDGYYNDLKSDGAEMRRNYVDNNGDIFNLNIIHPTPHPIYILMAGFQDAGLELQGDIISDPVLQKKWIFSGTEYFGKVNQFSNEVRVLSNESIKSEWKDHINYVRILEFTYGKEENLNFQDLVFVNVTFRAKVQAKWTLKFKVRINGNDIFSHEEYYTEYSDVIKTFQTSINVNFAKISFHVEGAVVGINEAYEVIKYELKSNSIITVESEAQDFDNSLVKNANKIDLKKAVPDMTFGEYFNILKNWLNYDLDIVDNIAIMNKINTEEISNVKDFTDYETKYPKRTFLNKKSWLLKFDELDNDVKKDSLFFDSAGVKINGTENEETNVIEINGYVMPVKLPKENGYNTAMVMKDSSNTLALVDYDGLKNGQNNANSASDCDFPDLFETHWKRWLQMRLNGQEFNWSATIKIWHMSLYNIKDYIYAYNNIHIIKNWSKNKISRDYYQVEFTTETIS